jgi:hypothetical protein
MMWFLLLAFPAVVLGMGIVARAGKVTATDTACAVVDLQLDRQAESIRTRAAAHQSWVPQQRKPSRVAPRPVPHLGTELLAG